ncbi:MAG: S1 RNA-binding domain-containing protein [Phycisphaerae bacterium]
MSPQDNEKQVGNESNLDPELSREIDAALGDMNVEELLAAEEADRKQAAEEDKPSASGVRKGTVVGIRKDDIFVELGGKAQGVLPAGQFEDEPLPNIGDEVEFTIEGRDKEDNLLLLSRKGAVLAATWDNLHVGAVVEGRVVDKNKGGLELKLGSVRAFMPISQIELGRVEDLSPYLNRKLNCEIIELNRSDDKVVVSQRKVLEKLAEQAKEENLAKLEEGQVVSGKVRSIMPYGAFVDIGGMDGLLHVSDMSWSRVEKPEDVVYTGQELQVKVLKIDRDKERIGLGLKQVHGDPWEDVDKKYPPDSVVEGTVRRVEKFGAFVELEPGLEGLLPVSEMSWGRIGHPREVVTKGDKIRLKVLTVEPSRNRMSLSLKQIGDDPWMGASARWPVESTQQGKVTRITDFGAFVELAPGVEGLVHVSEMASGFVKNPHEVVREGDQVEVRVLSVDEEKRRISLSMKKEGEAEEFTSRFEDVPEKPRKKGKLKGGIDVGGMGMGLGDLDLDKFKK